MGRRPCPALVALGSPFLCPAAQGLLCLWRQEAGRPLTALRCLQLLRGEWGEGVLRGAQACLGPKLGGGSFLGMHPGSGCQGGTTNLVTAQKDGWDLRKEPRLCQDGQTALGPRRGPCPAGQQGLDHRPQRPPPAAGQCRQPAGGTQLPPPHLCSYVPAHHRTNGVALPVARL